MIGVVFTDEKIWLAQIYKNKQNTPEIKKLDQMDLYNFELINLTIFNPIKISKFIQNFIIKNKLQNLPVVFCLDGSKLTEFYNKSSSCQNDNCECGICKNYNTSQANFNDINYSCQISYGLLFQYKLLAINLKLNLVSIVTDVIAISNLLDKKIDFKKIFTENSQKNPQELRSFLEKKISDINPESKSKYEISQLLGIGYII